MSSNENETTKAKNILGMIMLIDYEYFDPDAFNEDFCSTQHIMFCSLTHYPKLEKQLALLKMIGFQSATRRENFLKATPTICLLK